MELIVAVYDDWGIGRDGTQPIALSADRKFFREMTRGAMVIVGRRTIADFPGQKPLPGRVNVALTRTEQEIPGFTVCYSPEAAVELAKTAQRAMVIGGGSIYKQMLPYCDQVKVAGGALRAARAGRTIYTPKLFYKFYRCLAKITPVKLMVKFTKT